MARRGEARRSRVVAWLVAERCDRRRAYAAYIAALTVEEHAARRIQDRLTALTSL